MRTNKMSLVKKYLEMLPVVAEMKGNIDSTKGDLNDIHYESIVAVPFSFLGISAQETS